MRSLPPQRSATALRRAAAGESTRTIVIALLANIVIAIAKLIAGLVSRSTGLLAEAAHSAADSVNELFLAVGLHRERAPADAMHPSGHGRERFLWAFMAAISSFLIGGCVSISLAIAELRERHAVSSIFMIFDGIKTRIFFCAIISAVILSLIGLRRVKFACR